MKWCGSPTSRGLRSPVEQWLDDRRAWMTHGLERLAKAARAGAIPGGVIRDGGLNIDRLAAEVAALASARSRCGNTPRGSYMSMRRLILSSHASSRSRQSRSSEVSFLISLHPFH